MTKVQHSKPVRAVTVALAAVLIAVLAAGCRPADKSAATTGSPTTTAGSGNMAGMNMGSGTKVGGVDNIKPVPTQVLGTADWQGMKIQAKAMTAVPFIIYNGKAKKVVKPGPHASFHLMVFLSDAQTNAVIPYASVWATITRDGKTDFTNKLWPMISRYMGPHYGDDVTLPGPGTYQMNLLISPPVSARHIEYENVWLEPHHVSFTFPWKPGGGA